MKNHSQFCVFKLLQLCESLITAGGADSLRKSKSNTSFFNGALSRRNELICEMNDGAVVGMLECVYEKLVKSFLFATSLIELSVLLSHGGHVFFVVFNSNSVARS